MRVTTLWLRQITRQRDLGCARQKTKVVRQKGGRSRNYGITELRIYGIADRAVAGS